MLRLTVCSRTDRVLSDVAHDRVHFPLQVPPYFSRNTLHHGPLTFVEVMHVPG